MNITLIGPMLEHGHSRFPEAGNNSLPLLDVEETDIRPVGGCRMEDKFRSVCDANSNVICEVGDSCVYLVAHSMCLHLLHSFSRLTTFQLWDLSRTSIAHGCSSAGIGNSYRRGRLSGNLEVNQCICCPLLWTRGPSSSKIVEPCSAFYGSTANVAFTVTEGCPNVGFHCSRQVRRDASIYALSSSTM
jgi:hypothetical protein